MAREYWWALITLIVAITLATLLLFFTRDDPKGQTQLYAGIPLDEHLIPIDKAALTDAYRQHLILLWSNWLKDQAGDATRITNGLRIARRAYHEAAQQIERRERLLEEQKQKQKP